MLMDILSLKISILKCLGFFFVDDQYKVDKSEPNLTLTLKYHTPSAPLLAFYSSHPILALHSLTMNIYFSLVIDTSQSAAEKCH